MYICMKRYFVVTHWNRLASSITINNTNNLLLTAHTVSTLSIGAISVDPDQMLHSMESDQCLVFKSRWRRNSAHDCMALHCTEPLSFFHHLNMTNVEKDVKH